MKSISTLKPLLKKIWDQPNKIIIFFVLGLVSILVASNRSNDTAPGKLIQPLDIKIPRGYVLVPIKTINGASLIDLMGSHGVADIYSTESGRRKRLILARTKIIRTNDADFDFSALVKENKAELLSIDTPFS